MSAQANKGVVRRLSGDTPVLNLSWPHGSCPGPPAAAVDEVAFFQFRGRPIGEGWEIADTQIRLKQPGPRC